jgi:arylsulfatase A-like enzyme
MFLARPAWLWLAAALSACGPGAPDRPRLVVLYAPCTVAKQVLSPYQEGLAITPHLAAFAAESRVFTRHMTEAEQSGPAYAALFSGTQAHRHGAYNHPVQLSDELTLMAEVFAAAGYETWYWNGHPMAGAYLHYGQGVARERTRIHKHDQRGVLEPRTMKALSANEPAFDQLLARLAADPELEVYVQVNFTASHGPYSFYATPAQRREFAARFPERMAGLSGAELDRYAQLYEDNYLALQWDTEATFARLGLSEPERERLGEAIRVCYEVAIHGLDALFGEFLGRIRAHGLLEESLIAFTADHGEVLGRASALYRWTHGLQLARESLEIPLLLCAPGRVAPGRYEEVTRSIDVFPTLAGLCGIELPAGSGVEGTDLSPALRGEEAAPAQLAFVHTTILLEKHVRQYAEFPPVQRLYPRTDVALVWGGLRSGDRFYRLRNRGEERFATEAFDWSLDPDERADLYDPTAPADADMAGRLARYRELLIEAYERRTSGRIGEAEELESLRSLGYVR